MNRGPKGTTMVMCCARCALLFCKSYFVQWYCCIRLPFSWDFSCFSTVCFQLAIGRWLRFDCQIGAKPFSRMRRKGSRFTRSTLRLWPQPFATVRNRPQTSARLLYCRAYMVSSAGGVIFGGFKRLVASFRVAGVALRDIQRCFVTCRKSFLCGRRNTLDVLC